MEGAGGNTGGMRNTGTAKSKGAPARSSASMDGSLKRLAVEAAGEQKFLKSPTSNERALSAKEANKAVQQMQDGGLLVGDVVPKGGGHAAIKALAGPGLSGVLPRAEVVNAAYSHPAKDSLAGASQAMSDAEHLERGDAVKVASSPGAQDVARMAAGEQPTVVIAEAGTTGVSETRDTQARAGGDSRKDTTHNVQTTPQTPGGTPPEQTPGQPPGVSTSDRNAYVKDQIQAQQEYMKNLLGDKYPKMMEDLFGDAAAPKNFDVDVEIARLDSIPKDPDNPEPRRLLQQLKEQKSLAGVKEGFDELEALKKQPGNKDTAEYKAAVVAAQAKIDQARPTTRNIDAREQILSDPVFVRYLRDNNVDPESLDIAAVLEDIKLKEPDKLKELDVRMLHRLDEASNIALRHEGQGEYLSLKNSGENLLEGDGKRKAEAALAKIEKGEQSQQVQDVRKELTEAAAKDEKFAKQLTDAGINPQLIEQDSDLQQMGRIVTQWEEKQKHNTITDDEKKLLPKVRDILNGAKRKVVRQNIDNIDENRPDAMQLLSKNLLQLAETHKHDKGRFGKWKEKVGKDLERYSSAELKNKWSKAKGLSGSIRKLQNDLKTAAEADKEGIQKNIDTSKKLRGDLRREATRDWIVKWVVLFMVFGPALAGLLLTIGYAKLLQWINKAPGGQ